MAFFRKKREENFDDPLARKKPVPLMNFAAFLASWHFQLADSNIHHPTQLAEDEVVFFFEVTALLASLGIGSVWK